MYTPDGGYLFQNMLHKTYFELLSLLNTQFRWSYKKERNRVEVFALL